MSSVEIRTSATQSSDSSDEEAEPSFPPYQAETKWKVISDPQSHNAVVIKGE